MMEPWPACDVTGVCEAPPDARGITNCIHCGKELVERNGYWYTWDADLVTDHPEPQDGPLNLPPDD